MDHTYGRQLKTDNSYFIYLFSSFFYQYFFFFSQFNVRESKADKDQKYMQLPGWAILDCC